MPDYQPLNCYEHIQDTACWVLLPITTTFCATLPVFHTSHYSFICKYDTCSSGNSMSTNPYTVIPRLTSDPANEFFG